MRGFIKWDSRVWLHMCNEGLSKTDFGLLLFIEEYSKMGEKVCTASDEKLAQYLHVAPPYAWRRLSLMWQDEWIAVEFDRKFRNRKIKLTSKVIKELKKHSEDNYWIKLDKDLLLKTYGLLTFSEVLIYCSILTDSDTGKKDREEDGHSTMFEEGFSFKSNGDLADLSGLSKMQVSRVLKGLKELGIIDFVYSNTNARSIKICVDLREDGSEEWIEKAMKKKKLNTKNNAQEKELNIDDDFIF